MKSLKRYAMTALALISVGTAIVAQNSSSSGVVRRTDGRQPGRNAGENEQQVTERMQAFFEEDVPSDADLAWMRIIYRQIDLDKAQNAPLYFPEEPIDGQENMFRIIMKLLANNQIAAYEYLDGREIFTDAYRLKIKDMLDRFHILYTDAKGSTEKNPKFLIEESDVPANEVLSYYIIERWEFDSRSNNLRTRVLAVCPVLHRSGDFGGEAIKYPMFWVKYSDLRPYLAQQQIFIDDDNNLARYNYDDYFVMTMYDGDIYKTRNLKNLSMAQLYPDSAALRHAQDSIQQRLDSFEDKLWVPTREELAARDSQNVAAATGDSTAVAGGNDQPAEEARPARSSRGRRPARVDNGGDDRPSNNGNAAPIRSVRRRR